VWYRNEYKTIRVISKLRANFNRDIEDEGLIVDNGIYSNVFLKS